MYHEESRKLQNQFDTRRLADRLVERLVRPAFTEEDRTFIESQRMFFLATTDADGFPDCSYKGGDPGFVRVLDERSWSSRAMTATECSRAWGISSPIPASGCSS